MAAAARSKVEAANCLESRLKHLKLNK
jgi:hypothetical protein